VKPSLVESSAPLNLQQTEKVFAEDDSQGFQLARWLPLLGIDGYEESCQSDN